MINRTYFQETFYDLDVEIAQRFAQAIREAWVTGKDFEGEKRKGFFLSKKRGFEDKLYVGNIHRIENHLYWNDEELQEDDQIVNVVVIDGPVTRDGDGCSYGSKDHRDQIMYANTIPQVVGHLFLLNTPGGAASARIDYEQAIADCREKGKPTVAWVDGLCCSAGQFVAALCDRTVVMNGRHTMGCIGTMCAFWGVPNGTVDQDGYRYIELVSVTSPDKNAEYREAVDGKTEKLQAELDRLGEEFREAVRKNRPLVKEEHLTGKTFDARDVMGELADEIGDYNRAIECVFELADKTLTAARLVTAEPENSESTESPEGPEEMAKLNKQQKQAIANSRGELMMAEDGHVTTEKQGFFGPETVEVATPKNDSNMVNEEKKPAEVEATQAATQEPEAPETEQIAEEAAASEEPAVNEVAQEKPESPESPEVPGEEAAKEEAPAAEETPAEAPANEGTAEEAMKEIDKITETLRNAEAMIAKKDKTIAELEERLTMLEEIADNRKATGELLVEECDSLKTHLSERDATIAERDKSIAEKDALIEKLTKQVNDFKAEVKELAGKPAPMASADSGIPSGNGTGAAPKQQKSRIKSGMSYKEILMIQKEKKG